MPACHPLTQPLRNLEPRLPGLRQRIAQHAIELVAQLAQFIVKDRKTDTVASQIDFGTVDGVLKVNSSLLSIVLHD